MKSSFVYFEFCRFPTIVELKTSENQNFALLYVIIQVVRFFILSEI